MQKAPNRHHRILRGFLGVNSAAHICGLLKLPACDRERIPLERSRARLLKWLWEELGDHLTKICFRAQNDCPAATAKRGGEELLS
jgi:hypothetical protein